MQDDPHSDYELDPASVLVVDDSRLSALKLAKAMRTLGHRAETASGGAEALQRLREETFDIVLLDIVMPGVDGYEVLDALKSDASLRDLPVIVISSLGDEIESVTKAIELGAEDFLPKDFEPAILRARVNASLARKRFRDRELEDFHDLEQLTRAARVIEAGAFRPAESSGSTRSPGGRTRSAGWRWSSGAWRRRYMTASGASTGPRGRSRERSSCSRPAGSSESFRPSHEWRRASARRRSAWRSGRTSSRHFYVLRSGRLAADGRDFGSPICASSLSGRSCSAAFISSPPSSFRGTWRPRRSPS